MVLPLLRFGKDSFGASNFVNSYLSEDGTRLIVKVIEEFLLSRKLYLPGTYSRSLTDPEGNTYLVYRIPGKWRSDVSLFMKGRFSEMSQEAKEAIRSHSGLLYKQKTVESANLLTDYRLMALDRHTSLKQTWEQELNADLSNQELLPVPGIESYFNFALVTQKSL